MNKPKNVSILKPAEDIEKQAEDNFESTLEPDVTELTEGDDPVEIENEQADKITFGSSFSPADGDLGDESEDMGDLPDSLKERNRYDPSMSTGETSYNQSELEENGMHITDADHVGLAYDDNDYTRDSEEEE